jgi:ribosomal protein L37AE/L43A
MADSSSRPHAPAALRDNEPDLLRCAACPMCQTPTSVTHHAIEAGAGWRCARCGHHWDAARLAVVAAYAAWTAAHNRVGRRGTDDSHDTAPYRDSPAERPGGRP